MPPSGIVEPVDVFKGQFDLPSGFPSPTPDQLGLEGLEEGFDGGIVETIALAAHRNLEPVLSQQLLIAMGTVLRPAVRVMNAARWRLGQVDGHLQRPDGEVAFHAVADGPTDHAPGIKIDENGEVKPALAGPDIADIAGPFLVGACCREILIEQVRAVLNL